MSTSATYNGETPRRSAGQVLVGTALVVAGGVWLVDSAGIAAVNWSLLPPALLGVLGLVLLAGLNERAASGLIPAGVLLIALIFVGYLVPPTRNFAPTVGDHSFAPVATKDMQGVYRHGIGPLYVDLSRIRFEESAHVSASLGMGDLTVTVPDGVQVEVRASAGMGNVDVLGERRSGIAPTLNFRSPGASTEDHVLTLDLSVGMGSVEVRR